MVDLTQNLRLHIDDYFLFEIIKSYIAIRKYNDIIYNIFTLLMHYCVLAKYQNIEFQRS